jgi:hypothetical protein
MANERIRQAAAESGVKLWQVAAKWGCNDGNFSRRLRHQFDQADEHRALEIINEIRKEVKQKRLSDVK